MIELEAAPRKEGVFEIGDMVHALDDEFEGDGEVVTWSARYGCFCVHFNISHHALHGCDGHTPDWRGRWYRPRDLKLLD